jgi:hypothetical protein
MGRELGLLLVLASCFLVQESAAIVNLTPLIPWQLQWQPPVTEWLLSTDPAVIPAANRLAWRKIGGQARKHVVLFSLEMSTTPS